MQLQERATGARFDLSPLPIGISDSSQKRPFRFRSGDCESNVRLVSHQEAPRRRRWRDVSEAGCEISGGEKVFSRSFASFRGHVLAVYSLRRLPREWPKSTQERRRWCTDVHEPSAYMLRNFPMNIGARFDALRAPQHHARRPSFHASSSRFFPGRHCDRSSSFHLEISRAPEAGAMPAYILKVLAPAAQSFIRHSHATLPSAACSPIDSLFTQDPKIWWREPKDLLVDFVDTVGAWRLSPFPGLQA